MKCEFILDTEIKRLNGKLEGNMLIMEGKKYKVLRGENKGLLILEV